MQVDSYFCIGQTHKVCQDFACNLRYQDRALGFISDGCSSAPDTDFGSRFMANAARSLVSKPELDFHPIHVAQGYAAAMEMDPNCLHATLGKVEVSHHGNFTASLEGDGFIIARRKEDKKLVVIGIEFSDNTPWYPFYRLDKIHRDSFASHAVTIREMLLDGADVVECNEGTFGIDKLDDCVYSREFCREEYDLAAVGSDGLSQYMKKSDLHYGRMTPIPIAEVFNEFFGGMNCNGVFIERAFNKVKRNFSKRDIHPQDDVSLAAVFIK